MTNPKWEIPADIYGIKLYKALPQGLALAVWNQAIAQSSHFTLNADTTLLQVYAYTKDMLLKWATGGEDYATGKDFDEVIPAGTLVLLRVPLKADGTYYTDIQVCGREAGGGIVIIEK